MQTDHVLLIDIGNTNLKASIGGPDGPPPFERAVIVPTFADPVLALEPGLLAACQRAGVAPQRVGACVASSVVPRADAPLERSVRALFGCATSFVPGDMPLGFDNMAAIPGNVGADRLVGCHAARRLYPEADNVVVIDFGTATTIDCVRGNDYLGGMTCPGIESAARALASGTAKLPDLTLTLDGPFHLGFDTMTSLNQGFIFGFAGLVEGLVQRTKAAIGGEAVVVATGGLAHTVADHCPTIHHVRGNLIFAGLYDAFMERTRKI